MEDASVNASVRWDPAEYARFSDQRARPLNDLLARVEAVDPAHVVDLGCGPGSLTRSLLDRWPSARVVGVDSSAEMLAQARPLEVAGRLRFVQGDVRSWRPEQPVDVLVSNATLQWVPRHEELFGGFVDAVVPGGTFAFQVPGNFAEPSHRLLAELRDSPRWHDALGALAADAPSSRDPADYVDILARLGCDVDAWESTYLHVLPGEDAVLAWMKGTGLRPVLSTLADEQARAFLDQYADALRRAYPPRPYGTVLPYRRIFVVARKLR